MNISLIFTEIAALLSRKKNATTRTIFCPNCFDSTEQVIPSPLHSPFSIDRTCAKCKGKFRAHLNPDGCTETEPFFPRNQQAQRLSPAEIEARVKKKHPETCVQVWNARASA